MSAEFSEADERLRGSTVLNVSRVVCGFRQPDSPHLGAKSRKVEELSLTMINGLLFCPISSISCVWNMDVSTATWRLGDLQCMSRE